LLTLSESTRQQEHGQAFGLIPNKNTVFPRFSKPRFFEIVITEEHKELARTLLRNGFFSIAFSYVPPCWFLFLGAEVTAKDASARTLSEFTASENPSPGKRDREEGNNEN